MIKKVVVIGMGFVGAAMSVVISSSKKNGKKLFKVCGIDKNNTEGSLKLSQLNKGKFPYKNSDANIKKFLKKNLKDKSLYFSSRLDELRNANYVIVSINFDVSIKETIQSKYLSEFNKILNSISSRINKNCLIIFESTLLPGTSKNIILPNFKKNFKARGIASKNLQYSYSFERVMPGNNYFESIKNYWRVFGSNSKIAEKRTYNFFSSFINTKKFPLTHMSDITSVELTKVIENTYRAVNIAFLDEWTKFSEDLNLDLYEIISAIHKRDSHKNLRYPGLGVGGYCLTKDPLMGKISDKVFSKNQLSFPLSLLATKINKEMPKTSINFIKKFHNIKIKDKILIAGVSYKNEIGDTRHTPSKLLFDFFLKKKCSIYMYDPFLSEWRENKKIVKVYTKPPNIKVDLIILATPHENFKNFDFSKFISKNRKLKIFDLNNIISDKLSKKLKKDKIFFKTLGKKA